MGKHILSCFITVALVVAGVLFLIAPNDTFAATARISVASDESEANGNSDVPYLSADSRYVVFESYASNLVSGDTNNTSDIFVRDQQLGTTARVSVSSSGAEGNGGSFNASISSDGRYVTFWSVAADLVSGDTNNAPDIFLRDTVLSTTERVSIGALGTEGNSGSGSNAHSSDGRYVAFDSHSSNLVSSDTNNASDIFIRDRGLGTTARVSVSSSGAQGNNGAFSPTLSSDGRYVAFVSDASDLVSNDTNGIRDVFIRDTVLSTTERVSISTSGGQGDSDSDDALISSDGRYVAFHSSAANLVSSDTNGVRDIFVRDRTNSITERVSIASTGAQGNGDSDILSISSDGRYVAFSSFASSLVPGDTNGMQDVFIHDRQTDTTIRISTDSSGNQGNGGSYNSSISSDGRYVAFDSSAVNLVSNDINSSDDIFVVFNNDGDGIADSVDTATSTYGSAFTDGITSGTITLRGNQYVTVADAVSSTQGVVLSANLKFSESVNVAATVSACGGATIVTLNNGDSTTVTCGSVAFGVIAGNIEAMLFADNGVTSTASISAGNSVTFHPEDNTLSASPDNVSPVIVVANGEEIVIAPGVTQSLVPPIQVQIDIKPGSSQNTINLGSNGTVPVAIFSTTAFNANTVNPTTITLASAPIQLKGNGTLMTSNQDINGDGLSDLVIHINTEAFQLTSTDTEAILKGYLFDGKKIRGTDMVQVME